MEASAMTGDGVEELFLKCARSILTKVETGKKKNKSRGKRRQPLHSIGCRLEKCVPFFLTKYLHL
jgi:GTPase SAR1 family protein